jgi:hypothetical protein
LEDSCQPSIIHATATSQFSVSDQDGRIWRQVAADENAAPGALPIGLIMQGGGSPTVSQRQIGSLHPFQSQQPEKILLSFNWID